MPTTATPSRLPRRRPARARRAARAALAAFALVVTVAAADVALLLHRAPTVAVTTPGSGDGTAYLLLGSDSRGRLPEADRERYADRHQASSERADLVMVLRTRSGGRVFSPDVSELGRYVVDDYVRSRRGRR